MPRKDLLPRQADRSIAGQLRALYQQKSVLDNTIGWLEQLEERGRSTVAGMPEMVPGVTHEVVRLFIESGRP